MYFTNTLKQELSTAKTNVHNMFDETFVVDNIETFVVDKHRCHMVNKFGVFVDEDHSKLSTLYWLYKLHKPSYKLRLYTL